MREHMRWKGGVCVKNQTTAERYFGSFGTLEVSIAYFSHAEMETVKVTALRGELQIETWIQEGRKMRLI